MAPKAPSEGQKVDLGQNAPVRQEPAGPVPSGSLAEESYSHGGEFANNVGIRAENQQQQSTSTSSSTGGSYESSNTSSGKNYQTSSSSSTGANYSQATSGNNSGASSNNSNANLENQKSYAGAAPTYVNNQYTTASGPHGKNISEVSSFDGKTVDGQKKALSAEPGSEDDPARRAEYQMELNNNSVSRAAGPTETGFTNETKYDALNAERSA
jgi:hypothetical protein